MLSASIGGYDPNQWALAGSGLWGTTANWQHATKSYAGFVPDGMGTANFPNSLTTSATVDLGGTIARCGR